MEIFNLERRAARDFWKRAVLSIGIGAVLGAAALPSRVAQGAEPLDNAYGTVAATARVVDRQGRPAPGVLVRFDVQLAGVVLEEPGGSGADRRTKWMTLRDRRSAVTRTDGVATALIPSPIHGTNGKPWFRGRVSVRATACPTAQHDAAAADPALAEADTDAASAAAFEIPAIPAVTGGAPILRVWEAPDRQVGGFPVWLGRDGRMDRVVVLVEGFDLYNRYSATDALRLIGGAGDALRGAGVDILVVNFRDSHVAPDALAPRVTEAIRAASEAAGNRPVAVAGLSAGGLAARWALVTAEESGAPLPVHTLLFLDTPHRGANLNPSLQALVLRYGTRADRAALGSAAAHTLLTQCITDPASQVKWRRIGVWPTHREVPTECRATAALHDTFYSRLQALNDRRGYPKRCRLVAIANSSRAVEEGTASGLLRLWVPWGGGWNLPSSEIDRAPGSLLPGLFATQFRVRFPLGLAGAYLKYPPTFIPAESALDAGPGERPPFDNWFARKDGLPSLPHDRVDPGAAAFAIRELLRPDAWSSSTGSDALAVGKKAGES